MTAIPACYPLSPTTPTMGNALDDSTRRVHTSSCFIRLCFTLQNIFSALYMAYTASVRCKNHQNKQTSNHPLFKWPISSYHAIFLHIRPVISTPVLRRSFLVVCSFSLKLLILCHTFFVFFPLASLSLLPCLPPVPHAHVLLHAHQSNPARIK